MTRAQHFFEKLGFSIEAYAVFFLVPPGCGIDVNDLPRSPKSLNDATLTFRETLWRLMERLF
jgi:hypothetical protein